MINEEKVKIMSRLAIYEQGKGRKHLPVSRYFRSDYVGLALIKNFFLVTFAYGLGLMAVGLYFSEFILENAHKLLLETLGYYILIGYGVTLGVYTVLVYIVFTVKYHLAKKSVKGYYKDLTGLDRIYVKEEQRMNARKKSGGHVS